MDYIIEYGEYEPRSSDESQQQIGGCLNEPFKHVYKVLEELYEDVVLIFNDMFQQELPVTEPENEPERVTTPIPVTIENVVDLSDFPQVEIGNRDQYCKLIEYLEGKIIGMELTRAENEINMVNQDIKLYTELYNSPDKISVYVTINDQGKITSIDRDGKIIAEFYVE